VETSPAAQKRGTCNPFWKTFPGLKEKKRTSLSAPAFPHSDDRRAFLKPVPPISRYNRINPISAAAAGEEEAAPEA